MSDAAKQDLLDRQIAILRDARDAGRISVYEFNCWMDDLTRPKGLRQILSWHLFASRPTDWPLP